MRKLLLAVALSMSLVACTTTSQQFYQNPQGQSVTSLCRAYGQSTDQQFRLDVYQELQRRGVDLETCQSRVAFENAAAIGVAAVGAAIIIGAAANGGGGGYYGGGSAVAWDRINGPYGGSTWRCRELFSGQFADDWRCAGMARVDSTWPGLG